MNKMTDMIGNFRVPNKINPKGSKARHILMKMTKVKDKERI